jgi:protease IV
MGMSDLLRALAGLITLPLTTVGSLYNNLMTGKKAILQVEVKRQPDSHARAAMLQRLRRIALDANVEGVLLELHGAPGNWAAVQDLHRVITRLKRANKAVYAWLEAPGNAELWLASACDRVFIAPIGQVGMVGVGAQLTFLGGALERLGIQPDFEAAGEYKSFGEMWTRTYPSQANQEAVQALIDDLQEQLVADIASGRGLAVGEVTAAIAEAPLSAEDACKRGLVDVLAYEDEVHHWLEEHHGKGTNLVPFAAWAFRDASIAWLQRFSEPSATVQVVHMEGPIMMDGRGGKVIRAHKVTPVLRALRKADHVKAVVLHVNSGGGDAVASDLMWREVDLLRAEKPVVACFEDVAASGGYYLAAPAHEIVARKGTLTGSIGVFGGKLVMGEGMRSIGITTHEIAAAPNATVFSPSRRFTDDQRTRFKASMQRFYDGFVQRVAAGRKRPEDVIEPHCRGRVWTGRHALERGLIDSHGDLFDAVERARILAGLPIEGYRRRDATTWPRRTLIQSVISQALQGSMALRLVETFVTAPTRALVELATAGGGVVMAAMMPFDIKLR